MEKYRSMSTAAARSVSRPRSTHSRSTIVGSKTPTRSTADPDDVDGTVSQLRRQSATPQHRLTPIDKRNKKRAAKKRRPRRPEATEVTSQYGGQDGVVGSGGGGPKFRVTSGRRGRLRPLISRRSRLEMAEMFGKVPVPPSVAKPERKLPIQSSGTDAHPEVLERGTTFTSSVVVVPDMSAEVSGAPSTFQMHNLPLNMSASTSGSDLELASPPSKSSETTPHLTVLQA